MQNRGRDWNGIRVLVIGAARQGIALARYLALRGAQVILNDQRSLEQLAEARLALVNLPVTWACGGHPMELLDGVDLVCPSGGVPLTLPLVVEAQRWGIPLSNDTQIFLDACPCLTIGITGSAGKTTTTSLVGRMVTQALGVEHTWVGGNIGSPLLAVVDQMLPGDLAILELSSFQLEILTSSVNIAAVLNITPNHLDRHGTMEAYRRAKGQIVSLQTPADCVILGRDDPGAWSLVPDAPGAVRSFGLHRPPAGGPGTCAEDGQVCIWDGQAAHPVLPVDCIPLRGDHNVQNVLAACAVADAAQLPVESMRAAIESFEGVPHRLELVRSWHGVDWYNDSIATAPERAIAAIHSFSEPIVLLAGGRDKKLPWDDFADLVHKRVDHLVLFGEAADLIYQAVGPLQASGRPYTLERCATLFDAVQAAARVAEAGDVVLLSPGGTSFDEFRDFEVRGEAYRKWVLDLT
jgi:UDP-N-acetylmuramoylalanine--D-glutamate ligase